ncbi:hypothetical protein J0H58_30505, partial [bacterium]|nr:hypothetical protein [bacterium]
EAGDPNDPGDATEAVAAGFDRCIQPTLLVVQGGQEESQLPVVLRVRVPGLAEAIRAVAW